MNQFWRDLKSFNKRKPKLPTRIDHAATVPDICHMWKDKFAGVLNSLDQSSAQELRQRLDAMEDTAVQWTTPGEIKHIVESLSTGKATGIDEIPSKFFKYAPPIVFHWLSKFFNALLVHQHVPVCITEVLLSPLLKSSLKDPGDSANYRPIAIANAVSKILENVLLNRLESFLQSPVGNLHVQRTWNGYLYICIEGYDKLL